MPLFKVEKAGLTKLAITSLGKEKTIQKLFEENLPTVLNVDFLHSEYTTSFGGRIDTLGIDKNGSPVIIEYKRKEDDNVINQGLSYLKWLLDHRADFEILCRNRHIETEVDWTSPRVICVAESYNKFDLDAAEILPIKIELFKYRIYENDLLYVESESQKPVKIKTSKIFAKAKKTRDLEALQKTYSVESHLGKATSNVRELFLRLKERITSIDDSIVEEPKSTYIAYKLTTNFVDVLIQRNSLKIFLNMPSGKLEDPNHFARDLEKPKHVAHWGNGDYEVTIKNEQDLETAFPLIRQSYNYNK
ncbi:MAG: DUF5655 domain-containing protein [Conexivisphaerales archaeon]